MVLNDARVCIRITKAIYCTFTFQFYFADDGGSSLRS